MKSVLTASVMLAVAVPVATAMPVASVSSRSRHCMRLRTVKQDERAANRIYAGTRSVSLHELRELGYDERCQRNPAARWFVRSYNRARGQQHYRRVHAPNWSPVVTASWYDDSGTTGCGFHATYGIATFVVPCGGTVKLKGPGGAVVTATRDDSGPYVSGRTFDLNPETKAALGCGDLCAVRYATNS